MRPMVILVMGVSGSGKSTLGEALARRLGWTFLEGDRFHPAGNIQKMAAGVPLNDEDRAPWLAALRAEIEARLGGGNVGGGGADGTVLACSALKQAYREQLRTGLEDQTPVVYLRGEPEVLRRRLERRSGHYMKAEMLESQLGTLEEPTPDEGGAIVALSTDLSVDEAVERVRRVLSLK